MAVNPLSLEAILVKAPTEAAAFAGGLAIAPALAPLLRDLENFTWSEHPSKALDLMLAAAVAAEDVATYDEMQQEALYGGYNPTRFAHAYGETLNAPGVGELLNLLRRNSEVQIDFVHGLRKAKLEPQWDAALTNLRDVRIPGPDLAYMVVRGVVPDGGTLPSHLPTHSDTLALPPQLSIDTIAEAAKTGWDAHRFGALVARSGLAMAPVMAAQAFFRGILSLTDYDLTIARGDLFPAYAAPVLEASRLIPTATAFVEAQVRGQATAAERRAGTALHGMTQAHSDLLYAIAGRGLAPHAITTGLARGGKYPGSYANVPEPYKSAIERALTRPEFSELAYANRYSYPSAFVIRSLATSGELDEPTTKQTLLDIGWPPPLVDKVVAAWFGTVTTGGDKHVAKAETQLWGTTHAAYKAGEITAADVTAALPHAGVATAAIPQILAVWDAERALVRKQLTLAQLKKAFTGQLANPATGQPWSAADVTAELLTRGFSSDDAATILEEW